MYLQFRRWNISINKKVELLIPAGDVSTFQIAVRYGADAIYIGGEAFSLSAKAKNFTLEEIGECINGKKEQ